MVFKWNEQSTLRFLDNFKNYQCLWNHKIDEYKNRTLRANAMKSLISDLNLEVTEEDIKHKIKTIRTRYATELTKIKQSTNSGCSDDAYVPTLYWFKHAEFLSTVCVPRQSTSNLEHVKLSMDALLTKNEDSMNEVESEQNSFQAGSEKQNTSNCENRKRKNDLLIDRTIKERKTLSEENKKDEDEFDLFCKSLAVQLKKMPLNRALICQEKLQSVMTQERLNQLSEFNVQSDQYGPYLSPTQQEVHLPMVTVHMTTPQDDHNYISVAKQEVQS